MNRKTVIVTGATGGIGRVLCEYLSQMGFDLILLARTEASLLKLVSDLNTKFSANHKSHRIDFSDTQSVLTCVEWVKTLGVEVSGLVVMPPQPLQTSECMPDVAEWSDLFNRCFANPLELVKGVVPLMGEAERGKIVIISGISSAQVLSHYATSNVLRCSWLAQAKTMAFALGEKNIHVNTVSLGGTLTEKYRAGIENRGLQENRSFEEQLAEETSNIPLRKYGSPEEVSNVVHGLLTSFSDHISGVNLLCDGGFTRAY